MTTLRWSDPAVALFLAMPLALTGLLIWGVHRAVRRLGEDDHARRRAVGVTAGIAGAWMAATWIAASRGALRATAAQP